MITLNLFDSLALVLESYQEFDMLFTRNIINKSSKKEIFFDYIQSILGSFSKKDILNKLPDISESTTERVLKQLLDSKEIQKIGERKTTRYIKKQ